MVRREKRGFTNCGCVGPGREIDCVWGRGGGGGGGGGGQVSLFVPRETNLWWFEVDRVSVKALAGPCRTEPTIVTEVGLRRMTVFGTGFYNIIKSEVNIDEL